MGSEYHSACGRWQVIAFVYFFPPLFSFAYEATFIPIHEFSCFSSSYSLPCPAGGASGYMVFCCTTAAYMFHPTSLLSVFEDSLNTSPTWGTKSDQQHCQLLGDIFNF